ncbi:hypothetical protein B0H10DRAFT_591429 [Mycena sp. CBHHK59/15]|nr:hypothetical protein B0H10DRAFT_591429 [Mycena sp. CBHHK59/15]
MLRPNAFGRILTFRLEGGFPKVTKVIENLWFASHLANIGELIGMLPISRRSNVGAQATRRLVIAHFVTVQGQLTDEGKVSGGVTDDLIRFSVGIESAEDIIADLEGALEIAYAPAGTCAL